MGRLRSDFQNPLPFYILSEFLTVALSYTLGLKMVPLSHAWNTVTLLGIGTDFFQLELKTNFKKIKIQNMQVESQIELKNRTKYSQVLCSPFYIPET